MKLFAYINKKLEDRKKLNEINRFNYSYSKTDSFTYSCSGGCGKSGMVSVIYESYPYRKLGTNGLTANNLVEKYKKAVGYLNFVVTDDGYYCKNCYSGID